MLNFGYLYYLEGKEIYIEKSFIVNNATKYNFDPAGILMYYKPSEIKEIIGKHMEEEKEIDSFFVRIDNINYELVITSDSLLLLKCSKNNKLVELIDEDKIKILKYYIMLMEGKREINQFYFDMYNVFRDDDIKKQKNLLKKARY